jgi:sulfur-oxidizing protein SoxB
MVRVGGLHYSCTPAAGAGKRIDNMRLSGELVQADKIYKVAGWAPVAEEAKNQGNKPIWEVVETWLHANSGRVSARRLNTPGLVGVRPNPGIATS